MAGIIYILNFFWEELSANPLHRLSFPWVEKISKRLGVFFSPFFFMIKHRLVLISSHKNQSQGWEVTDRDSAMGIEITEHLSHATFCLFLNPEGSLANFFYLVLKVEAYIRNKFDDMNSKKYCCLELDIISNKSVLIIWSQKYCPQWINMSVKAYTAKVVKHCSFFRHISISAYIHIQTRGHPVPNTIDWCLSISAHYHYFTDNQRK